MHLRHSLATIAYRGGKALRDAPAEFASYRATPSARSPLEILAHMGDLFEWALSMARGSQVWRSSEPLAWGQEVDRFYGALTALDQYLASPEPLHAPEERLFQGHIADALTHVGQLTMLRRLAGFAIKGENYFVADIVEGRTGTEQAPPRREF